MVNQNALVVAAILLATSCALTSAGGKEKSITSVIPFQPISSDEYKAILDLSEGNPVISEARLIGSGLSAIHHIANSIKNGAITALNLTGIESSANALLRPSDNKVQGYPLCVIRTNKGSRRGGRSIDSIFQPNNDAGSSEESGSYTINLYNPGYDDNNSDYDDDDYYHHYPSSTARPTRRPRPTRPNRPVWTGSNEDDGNASGSPVVNCVVVLKRPSSGTTQTTRRPTRRPTRPTHPTRPTQSSTYPPHYPPPHYPPYYPPHPQNPHNPQGPHNPHPTWSSSSSTSTTTTVKPHPHRPHYPYYPYPIIPVPIPPYHGGGYPGYPGFPGHVWGSWYHRPRPRPTTTTTTPPPSGPPTPHGWPIYPGHGSGGPSGHWRSPLETDGLKHHYLGNGAKDTIYDGSSVEAAEDDDVESEVSDIIEAIEKAKSARYNRNQLKVMPLPEDSEEGM